MNIFPNQTYKRTRDWAAGTALNLQQFQERYRVIYPSETIMLPRPKEWTRLDGDLPVTLMRHSWQ
ncbi:hypothetical protein PAV_1c05360 [Paenibacillus alvei DSM 29]|uniref:hypothetical protein n=1 Tax=Paenibacillus alvei TaxID=44250 RepID=UPI00028983A9|nr:hypothetical protein PAV_1c05360 [Paenibacillus alvei DSM 29]